MSDDERDKTTLSQDTLERARQAAGPRATLVIDHHGALKVVPLADGAAVIVGRSYPSDVVVDDPSLSRRHARFTRVSEGVRVEDLGSTNGTHHAGARVDGVTIAPGDAVTLGSVTVSLHLATPSAPLLEGVEGYERFFANLSDEIVRARSFRRALALVMVRALGFGEDAHVSRWAPRLRRTLRPVDRMTLHGETAVLMLLPETDRERARTVASALVSGDRMGEPTLVAGAALYGSSAGELIDSARSLARQGTARSRVVIEGDADAHTVTGRPLFASASMIALAELTERVASSDLTVLIHGETGTGKEVIAQLLHRASPRAKGPLRSVNCGAIPRSLMEAHLFGHERGAFTGADRTAPGLFEQASGGTLFLDEVGELTASAQAALLRVLETRRVTRVGGTEEIAVDVRLVAATHRDLEAMVAEGSFRRDLLYRLNSMTLAVPPLRERPEDLDALTARFLEEASRNAGGRVRGIDDDARARLRAYGWPGNVRELRNAIERAVVVCASETIGAGDLPPQLTEPVAVPRLAESVAIDTGREFKERVRAFETELILDALRRTGGNQTQAAKLLQMPLRTLVHKLRALGIKKSFE